MSNEQLNTLADTLVAAKLLQREMKKQQIAAFIAKNGTRKQWVNNQKKLPKNQK